MGVKHKMKVGDKIELVLDRPPYFRAQIEDIINEDSVIASMPTYRGTSVILRREQELTLYYYRPVGMMRHQVRVRQFYISGALKTVELEILNEPVREQRRISYRLNASIKVYVCSEFEDETVEANLSSDIDGIYHTKNISETGAAIVMKQPLEAGMQLTLEIHLPDSSGRENIIKALAEVRQVAHDHIKKTYQHGLQFLEIENKHRELLAKYIFKEQAKQIKQQRLVEGD